MFMYAFETNLEVRILNMILHDLIIMQLNMH